MPVSFASDARHINAPTHPVAAVDGVVDDFRLFTRGSQAHGSWRSSTEMALRMSNCSSTFNYYGVHVVTGGYLETRQNNTIRGNSYDVYAPLDPFGAL